MFSDVKLRLISPTGRGIRSDRQGSGYYGSPRGNRTHKGADYIAYPDQEVVAPIDGTIVRVAYPYRDKTYSGVVIENSFLSVKMFYFVPIPESIGKDVRQGTVIGHAQDISKRYSKGMVPHIHLQIDSIDPNIFVRK